MSSQRFRLRRLVYAAAVLAFNLVPVPAGAAAAPGVSAPVELLLNTTIRHATVEPAPGRVAAARFRVAVPQAGVLVLDLTVAGGAQPEPVLRLLGLSSPSGERARRVIQSPAALFVDVEEPAAFLVEVAALEQGQSLPAFRLSTAFQAADVAGGDPIGAGVDPWDDDLDGKKPSGLAIAGDDLCGIDESDDHGDFPRCATPITTSANGVLDNEAGDDEDLFAFRLSTTSVLAIEATSGAALQLVLRDRGGVAMAVVRSEGPGVPLRLARALAAGRYFLEVESPNGDAAVYRLILHRP